MNKLILVLVSLVLFACSGSVTLEEPVQDSAAPESVCVTQVFGPYAEPAANVTWGNGSEGPGCQTGDLCQVYLGANFLSNGVCK